MKIYNKHDLIELHKLSKKYWKTREEDSFPRRANLAQSIGKSDWVGVLDVASFVARKGKPYHVLVDVLKLLGYEADTELKSNREEQ